MQTLRRKNRGLEFLNFNEARNREIAEFPTKPKTKDQRGFLLQTSLASA
jgi:hypothetical protein